MRDILSLTNLYRGYTNFCNKAKGKNHKIFFPIKVIPGGKHHCRITIVIATQRSGHHAFIESYTKGLSSYLYLNDADTTRSVKKDTYKPSNVVSNCLDIKKILNNREINLRESGIENLIVSFESRTPAAILASGRLKGVAEACRLSEKEGRGILFLRDPLNTLSSMQKYNEVNSKPRFNIQKEFENWLDLAKSFLYETDLTRFLTNNSFRVYRFSYNRFIRNHIKLAPEGGNDDILRPPAALSRFGGGGDTRFEEAALTSSFSHAENRFRYIENSDIIRKVLRQRTNGDVGRFCSREGVDHLTGMP